MRESRKNASAAAFAKLMTMWKRRSAFAGETRGATAVEFALVSPFLFLTIFFLLSIGYMILMKQSLDYATQKAARQIRTGQTQAAGINTAAQFATQAVCPYLPSLFSCSNVFVYSGDYPPTIWTSWSYPYTIYTPYINSNNTGLILLPLNSSGTFCPGSASYYVFLQVFYPVPFFMSFLSSSAIATTYNGQPMWVIQSTAVFLNEPFTATGTC